MRLTYVVVTSVTRDDLPDGGAAVFAETVRALRGGLPGAGVELLVPDFRGSETSLATVLDAGPDVLNHNLETVRRLQPIIRPQASYRRSLGVLREAARRRPRVAVKSGLMLGLGEEDEEVEQAMADLVSAGCELLTLGQYLRPTPAHHPVARFVAPDAFRRHADKALAMGFKAVASGPMVRSSHRAHELLAEARGSPAPESAAPARREARGQGA
jgi:lipoic acid synthetase